MAKSKTTPAGLFAPAPAEHNCYPLHVGGKLVATCARHYGQAPVLRGAK